MIPFNETTSEKHIDARLHVTYDIDIGENEENKNKKNFKKNSLLLYIDRLLAQWQDQRVSDVHLRTAMNTPLKPTSSIYRYNDLMKCHL